MNTNHKHISKNILMNSVIQDPFKEVQRKFKQYNIIQDESYFDYELLKAALDRRHQAIIKLLLKLNCRVRNPNKINSEDTVLHRAMKIDKTEIIIKILRNGASIYDKNMRGETAVYVAFKDGYHHAVNTVLKFVYLNNTGFKHLNPLNKDDLNHFNIACALNNVSVVTQFLNFRFNINFPFTLDYPDMNGVYPLHYAVKKNYSNLFELFLRYGADLNVKNSKGQTPLHILYYSGRFGLSMMTSAFNSKNETKFINSVDDNGVSHFHLCCTVNNPGTVKLFIDKGVDINSATSVTEYSPLHLAVMHDCHEVVDLLLKNGADCNKADAKGCTPLHLACEKANPTGTQYIPPDATAPMRDSPTHWTAREQLKNKKRHIAEKMLANHKQNGLSVVPEYLTIFQKKHKNGTIDVWWLYDDGGLTILLPYIISTRSNWEHCKMRIFALANHKQDIGAQEKEMAEIMAKFRIKYTSLKMVDDISVQPRPETQSFFDKVISEFRKNDAADGTECVVTESELQTLRDKTFRQLRLRELLLENSSQSTLVVMSLPMPRKGAVSAPLYMAWLEALTRDMPPTLLIRGNHSSVLTFYS